MEIGSNTTVYLWKQKEIADRNVVLYGKERTLNMVMNVQKLVVLLIALFLTMRLLYLEVNSHIKNDAEKEKDSIYALIYWLMHINVIILYYGSYVLESNRILSFSMPGDIVFVILFTLPTLLTLKDCVRRKK